MKSIGKPLVHLTALATVTVWGSTFVFTKMLLQAGLSPAQIFTLRFLTAYVLLLVFSAVTHRLSLRSKCWQDEGVMLLLGVTGGSLYFLAENAALLFTTATNASLIVCSCPLFTMLLVALFFRRSERFTRRQATGSLLAFIGMAAVVLNGHFVLRLSPVGDLLAFVACLCWAVYSLLMRYASAFYSPLFITRKVFFYGLLTIIPYYIVRPGFPSWQLLLRPDVALNLLFLGVVASMLCFLVWNWVIRRLGALVATNWVYLNPVSTILFAWWLLGEQITLWFLLGTVFILLGMFVCDRR